MSSIIYAHHTEFTPVSFYIQVGQAILDGLLNAAMFGHINAAASIGADVFVRAPATTASTATADVFTIAFTRDVTPPLPTREFDPIEDSFSLLSAALLRGAVAGSKQVSLVAGAGRLAWPPVGASNARRAAGGTMATVQSNTPSYVLCSPAYALSATRYSALDTTNLLFRVSDPLPPCGFDRQTGADADIVSLSAPQPTVAIPSSTWAVIAGASSSSTVDATLVLWGLPPIPSASGWDAATEAFAPGLNVSEAALATLSSGKIRRLGAAPSSQTLRLRRLTQASSQPPQPCSGVLDRTIKEFTYNNISLPVLSPSQPSRGLDTHVLTVTVTDPDGTKISAWSSSSSANGAGNELTIFIPFTAASAVRTCARRAFCLYFFLISVCGCGLPPHTVYKENTCSL